MTICMLCVLRALVKGEVPQPFEEHPFDHMRSYHPDPQEAANEQDRLTDEVMTMALNGKLPGLDAEAFAPTRES